MAVDHSEDDRTRSFAVLARGAMVSHYRIIEKIGAGGMGEVFLAEDTKLNRQVALKFLPAQYTSDENSKARFTREAQATAALDHPNIITIHEVSEYQGRPFFAMQYIKGQSLRDFAKDKKLSANEILTLAIQICEGLSKAHKAGIIHRDIKPSNIIIDADNRAKILDFGLATIQGGERLTRTGSTLGTMGYMSPEQIQGQEIDCRTDLFSFGIVLYEMITGRVPFAGETDAAILHAIISKTPEVPTGYRPDIPPRLQEIVGKTLEKDPQARYQSATELIADLKSLAGSTEVRVSVPATVPWARPARARWAKVLVVAAFVILIAVAYGVLSRISWKPIEDASTSRIMLAVLPFRNLGAPEEEYFADGITDEIITRIAGFQGLGVISRTSAMQYKNSEKSLQEIGKELGVDYILEGTIRWDKSGDTDRVRITPQLVRAADDTYLWSSIYERALTQIFAVQADIARQIAGALDIALLAHERRKLATEPTDNIEAYTYYLRGREYMAQSYHKNDHLIAIEMLEKAVELDPDFALAFATLSSACTWLYWLYERTDEQLIKARDAVDKALWLEPNLPEAHLALGQYYYQGKRDYERALIEVDMVKKSLPSNTEAFLWTAGVRRRQGQWGETVRNLEQVTKLNPRNSKYFWELGRTLTAMRKYQEAVDYYDRAIAVSPDYALAYGEKAFTYLLWDGNTTQARQVLEDAAQKIDRSELAYELADCDMFEGDYQSALRRFPAEALPALRHRANYYLTIGFIYRLMNDTTLSVACYDSVRVMLEPKIEKAGSMDHARLGVAYAGLGRKEEAMREGQLAAELLPLSEDAYVGTIRLGFLAMIYVMVGEYDLAIDQLEILLSVPSFFSVPYLRLNPVYAPLRDHPRFQILLEEYA